MEPQPPLDEPDGPQPASEPAPGPAESATTDTPTAPTPDPQTPLTIPSELWLVLLLEALAVISFLPALSSAFFAEDYLLVVGNPLVRGPAAIPAMFTQPFLTIQPNSYHPLCMLTYMTDFLVWRLNPVGYHSTNLTLHLIATLLVYSVSRLLLRRRSVAFAAGAVFAVHPVHAQSVAWIAGRPQLLATCLALFALHAYASYVGTFDRKPWRRGLATGYYLTSVICFTLAVFAHAAAGALIVLLPLYEVTLARQRIEAVAGRRVWRPYLGLAVGLALYLAMRWLALGYHLVASSGLRDWPAHLYSAPVWALRAVGMMLLPLRTHPTIAAQLAPGPLHPAVLGAAAAMAIIAILAIRLRRLSAPAAFAAWWALLTLAPTLNWLPLIKPEFAARDFYLPSVGVAILVGWAVIRIADGARRRRERWLVRLVIAAFAVALVWGMRTCWSRAEGYGGIAAPAAQPTAALSTMRDWERPALVRADSVVPRPPRDPERA